MRWVYVRIYIGERCVTTSPYTGIYWNLVQLAFTDVEQNGLLLCVFFILSLFHCDLHVIDLSWSGVTSEALLLISVITWATLATRCRQKKTCPLHLAYKIYLSLVFFFSRSPLFVTASKRSDEPQNKLLMCQWKSYYLKRSYIVFKHNNSNALSMI